ncbi:hypothetical protein [Rhizobium hainanense]|uniref:Uncharacterized protein n=1 Tax=Rhizobium hainanense TaxID=52131 RepID=A0A1C3U9X9_9HYPH|nr:hypothetical protein GA0061100_1011050 [Rhizobium hainanense]
MQKRIFATTQGLMRILCAVALMSVGFAHHPALASAAELPPLELSQYRLPDGSLPIICTTEKTADGKQHGKAHMPGCEACRISAVALLPRPPAEMCGNLASVREGPVPSKTAAFRRQLHPPNCGPRAPPAFQTLA